MRSLGVVMLWMAASTSAWAQTLSATGDVTFQLTTPLPITDAATPIAGMGAVSVACSPCASSSNSHHYGFGGVEFRYVQAPSEPHALRVSGVNADNNMSSWSYTANGLPRGVRLFPRLVDAFCVCGNGAETSNRHTVDKMNLAFTVNPYFGKPLIFGARSNGDVAVGTEVRLSGSACSAGPKGTESVRFRISGAGVDVTQDFAKPVDSFSPGIAFTATSVGAISITCSLEPYGAVSNVQTVNAVIVGGGTGGGSGGSGGAGGSGGGGGAPAGGCSSVPGAFAALAVLLARRRC